MFSMKSRDAPTEKAALEAQARGRVSLRIASRAARSALSPSCRPCHAPLPACLLPDHMQVKQWKTEIRAGISQVNRDIRGVSLVGRAPRRRLQRANRSRTER